ncbi:MAG: GNAT family N-acetyltransferase [Planctomycetota bacterium]
MSLILETERLQLRVPSTDDAPFFLELLNDPDWHRFVNDPGVRDLAAAAAWVESRLLQLMKEHGFTLYLVERKSDQAPLGLCGLVKRDSLEHPDLGFGFLPQFRRQGIAAEAAEACIILARDHFSIERLYAITAQDNDPSAALLRKLGFTSDGLQEMEGEDIPLARFVLPLKTPEQ